MPRHHGNDAFVILFCAGFIIQAQSRLALLFIRAMAKKAVLTQDGPDLLGEMDGARCWLCDGGGSE